MGVAPDPQCPLWGREVARNYDNWLRAYMAYTADSESPDDFHFWTGVWTLAGALRRRVWIDMRKFQWTPNFYIVLVGPPGIITKSTSMRSGMRLLERLPDVHFGPPSITWQRLADALAAAVEHIELKDLDPITGEKVFLPMSCLSIPVSELGTFLKIDDGALVDVLTDLWDGQLTSWGHETKTSGQTKIKNPWLNIIGCTTPSWLRTNFPDHLIGGGLTSRIIFVYGERKRRLVAYPDEVIPDREYREMEEKLTQDLMQVAALQGEYRLTPTARQWGKDWYEKHWVSARPLHMASDRYEGYLARKQTHIHKMSIVLAAARSNDLVIEREHLEEAEALLGSAEPHMMKVFESVGVVDEAKHVAEICAYVRAHKVLTSDELWGLVSNLMSMRDFEDAIRSAVRGGALTIVNHHTQKKPDGSPKRALAPTQTLH